MATATENKTTEAGNGSQALAHKAAAPKVPIPGGSRGMELHNLDEMWRFANAVAASGLAPKGIDRPESILVALQMGMELGLTPMASLQNIAVINGRPTVWGDAQMAVCRGSGVFDEEAFDETITGSGESMTATCTVRRLPKGKPVTRSFSVADAKTAALWDKAGPWTQYPKRMLQMRARSFALRDAFSDVLRGFQTTEEVRDAIDVDARPVSAAVHSLEDLRQQWTQPTAQQAEPHLEQPAPEAVDPPAPTADELTAAEVAILERCSAEIEAAQGLAEVSTVEDHWIKLHPEAEAGVKNLGNLRREVIRSSRGERANKSK